MQKKFREGILGTADTSSANHVMVPLHKIISLEIGTAVANFSQPGRDIVEEVQRGHFGDSE